jgi:murein DD-endopeptidase MepM/ murein hydrolase activator NlpD
MGAWVATLSLLSVPVRGIHAVPASAVARLAAAPGMEVEIAARSLQPGELTVITMTAPDGTGEVRVHLFDRTADAFPIGGGRWKALAGIDLDQKPGSYPLTVDGVLDGRPLSGRRVVVVVAKAFPTRTLRVAPQFVEPPANLQERIERENALVNAAYAASAPQRLWAEPFTRPVPQPANSSFGTRSVFNGQRRSPHGGTDFLSGAGTPIKAPNAGRVAVARDLFFTGNTVIIDHGLGLFSMLAHLSRIDVQEGATIANGEIVGLVGATGRVTGPHLHWALRVNGARVDALSALQLLGPGARRTDESQPVPSAAPQPARKSSRHSPRR